MNRPTTSLSSFSAASFWRWYWYYGQACGQVRGIA